MPLFTTIIPVYNRGGLIEETLKTVFAQQLSDQEIIVIDDGSTDDTLERLEQFQSRVRLIRQVNSGPAMARNRALAQATGEYIAFLDSDDLWFPWSLATYAGIIHNFSGPSFIAGCPFVFRSSAEVSSVAEEPLKLESFPDYLASGDKWRWHGVSSFVIKRSVLLEKGGFREELSGCEDADLALRLGDDRSFIDVQAPPTFAYREHAGSLKGDAASATRGFAHMIHQEKAGAYPGGRARRGERRRILTRHIRPHSMGLANDGKFVTALRFYFQTLVWHVALGRVAYLLSLPAIALMGLLKAKAK
jgi:hypothetical protein